MIICAPIHDALLLEAPADEVDEQAAQLSAIMQHASELVLGDGRFCGVDVDKVIFPVPYDFDMSGQVNASYAVVSNINDTELPISEVTQRMYRGFKRHDSILQKVRKEFLDNESNLLSEVHELKPYFENPKEFESALKYINSFFLVISDDAKFKRSILDMARTK